MPTRTTTLHLEPSVRDELQARVRSRALRAEDARRARLILMLADGESYTSICRTLACNPSFVSRWKTRFAAEGLSGLHSQYWGRQVERRTPELEARILNWTRRKPTDGSTHWSTRKLARKLSVSHMMVARVWARAGLRPHRMERYMASNDPDFEAKAADVIGLYVNPPQHAAVFCVDEKTAIQALDRLDPVLPLSPGRAERHGFEYYRHGTLSLYAALDVKTGQVQGMTAGRHTSSSSLSSKAWWRVPDGPNRFMWCSTISPRTRPRTSTTSSLSIRTSASTSPQPIRPGSIRLNSGSLRFSAM